jgi:hypothetical protein
LCHCISLKILKELEIYYVALCSCNTRKYGLNLNDGGEGGNGWKPSKKHLKWLSDKMMGKNNHFYGKTHSEETKNKLRIASSGYNSKNYKIAEKHPNYNKPLSDEHKNNISKSNIDQTRFNFVHDNGEIYNGNTFNFCKKYNLDNSCVSKLIRHKLKQVKGWRYFGDKIISIIPKRYKFYNLFDNTEFIGTARELREKFNLTKSGTSELVHKYTVHRGWKILEILS